MNLPFNFDHALEGLTKVTLRGGVVGKVTFSIVVVSLALASITYSVPNIWLAAGSIVAIFILAFTMLWRLITFADRNPQAALLEGAEFLMHEQIIHASKFAPIGPNASAIQVQPEPIEGPAANPELARIPDQEPLLVENNKGQS